MPAFTAVSEKQTVRTAAWFLAEVQLPDTPVLGDGVSPDASRRKWWEEPICNTRDSHL